MKKLFIKRHTIIFGIVLISLVTIFLSIHISRLSKLPDIKIPDISGFANDAQKRINQAYENNMANPNDPEANGELGRVLHQYGLLEFSGNAFLRAHLLQPEKFRWLYYLGLTQALRKQNEVAINTFRKVLEMRPNHSQTRIRIADLLLNMGQTEEAIQLFLTVLDENPNFIRAHYGLAQAYRTQGDLQSAAEHFHKAIAIYEKYADAHYALGLVYRDLSQPELAEKHLLDFEKYKEIQPPHQDTLIKLLYEGYEGIHSRMLKVKRLADKGKLLKAIRVANDVLKDRPDHLPAHVTLIALYTNVNKFEKAQLHYRKAIKINPDDQGAHFYYGQLLLIKNREAEAMDIFRKVVDINPQHAEALSNLGVLYNKQGEPGVAEDFFKKAVQSNPNDATINYNYGRFSLLNGQVDTAIEFFDKATSLQNDDTELLVNIARSFAKINYRTMVISYYRRARDLATELEQWKWLAEIERELCYWQN